MQATLICCALLLIQPRNNMWGIRRHIHTGVVLCTILGVTLLHSLVPVISLLPFTLILVSLNLFSTAKSSMFNALKGLILGLFVSRCHRLYPFEQIYGLPTELLLGLLIGCLMVLFAKNSREAWGIWSYSYLAGLAIDFTSGFIDIKTSVSWFWLVELVLTSFYTIRWAFELVMRRISRETV